MKNSQKTTKILIGIVVLAILIILGLNSRKNSQLDLQMSGSEQNDILFEDDNTEMLPSDIDNEETSETPAVKKSTPAERVERVASPSDAASYSEDDLPPEFNEAPADMNANTEN